MTEITYGDRVLTTFMTPLGNQVTNYSKKKIGQFAFGREHLHTYSGEHDSWTNNFFSLSLPFEWSISVALHFY